MADMTIKSLIFCVLPLGCGEPVDWPDKDTGDSWPSTADADTDTDTDTDTDADTDADTDTDSEVDPDRSPEVTWAEAYCYHHDVGTEFDQWVLSATADDPQGTFTLSTTGTVEVRDAGGTPKATYVLACSVDTGACSGAFHDYDDGFLCDTASSYTFRFRVEDQEGFVSAPYEVRGENHGR